jgi:hypothetical protein
LGEESTAGGVGGELHQAGFDAFEGGQAVVLGKAFVEEREVRIDEVAGGEVVLDEVLEEEPGFAEGRFGEKVVEVVIRVELGIRGIGIDLP